MIAVKTKIEHWELIEPFATARESLTDVAVLVAHMTDKKGVRGWSEAMGVDHETPESIAAQIEDLKHALHDRISGDDLLELLPPAARATRSIARSGTCAPSSPDARFGNWPAWLRRVPS